MSLKLVATILLVIGVSVAVVEDIPQKAWDSFKQTELAATIFSWGGGEEKLSGPLRAFLDGQSGTDLSASGVVHFTNKHRDENGLMPLHVNEKLNKAAEAKVNDMFEKQYFEHESPDGKSPADVIRTQNYEYIVVGENLALGNFENDEVLVQAWMDSPGHRANVLSAKFQEIGVYAKKGMFEGKEVWLAVQEFGSPLSSCPSPKKNMKSQIDAQRAQLDANQIELQRQKEQLSASRYEDEASYNAAVDRYNDLVKKTNQLSEQTQELVRQYNDAVNAFNSCLESNA